MKHLNRKYFQSWGKRKGKRFLSALLVAGFLLAVPAMEGEYKTPWNSPLEVFATTAKDKKEEAEQGLKDANDTIDDIKDRQEDLENDMASAAAELEQLFADQAELQEQIEDTQARVDQANLDLEDAKEREEKEYEEMKLRIQYMYENNTGNSFWKAILESDGIGDMLSRVEYIADVYQSDRDLMEKYEQAVQEVEDLTLQLAQEMDELLALQEGYLAQQAEVETLIASLEGQADVYAEQLAEAEALAKAFEKTIDEQDEIIRQQLAAASAGQNQSGGNTNSGSASNSGSSTNNGSGSSTNTGTGSNTGSSTNSGSSSVAGTEPAAGSETPSDPGSSSSTDGTAVVNYALQFVGNPYKWGGNSLTDGCDCSGFVNLVYKHFGYSMPRYSMSFATVGRAVDYNDMQAGDIVVYEPVNGIGHVAIYMGNGRIVEAQSTKAGITSTRSVDCRTIVAIRRVL